MFSVNDVFDLSKVFDLNFEPKEKEILIKLSRVLMFDVIYGDDDGDLFSKKLLKKFVPIK